MFINNIFNRASAHRFALPVPSAWHVITTLLVLVLLEAAFIAYTFDMRVLAVGAILNAVHVVYQGVRNG